MSDYELMADCGTMVISIWREGFYVEKIDFPDEQSNEEWCYSVKCECHDHTHFAGTKAECDEWLNPLTPTHQMLN